MKPAISIAALALLALPVGMGCKKDAPTNNDNLQPAVVTEPGAVATAPVGHGGQAGAPVGHGGAASADPSTTGQLAEGPIAETMNAGGYTYVLVEVGAEKVWVAGPETVVKVGDKVSFSKGMPMANFRSNSLNRTFDMVYFVSALTINGSAAAPVAREKAPGAAPATFSVDVKGVKKATGGKTIGELFEGKAAMSGKPVSVRGIVVKYNSGIMGSNWIHIKDGSGAAGTDDLTVTTSMSAKVGDTVLIEGVVALDKNFGGGYKYDLIVENAKVTVE